MHKTKSNSYPRRISNASGTCFHHQSLYSIKCKLKVQTGQLTLGIMQTVPLWKKVITFFNQILHVLKITLKYPASHVSELANIHFYFVLTLILLFLFYLLPYCHTRCQLDTPPNTKSVFILHELTIKFIGSWQN